MNVIADYQQFSTDLSFIGERMSKKLEAFPPIDFTDKRVLDVGCDHGFWCVYAANQGAREVVGLDRGREVKGKGFVNLAELNDPGDYPIAYFEHHAGRQWKEYGKFDVILVQSVFHHIFQSAGGNALPIWYWLRRQIADDGVLVWEGPVDASDSVIQANVDPRLHEIYGDCLEQPYFDVEYYGPAIHEETREVYILKPRAFIEEAYQGLNVSSDGSPVWKSGGMASKVFQIANSRRLKELEFSLGIKVIPGTLNLLLDADFDWESGFYLAPMMDVKNRKEGLQGEWAPKWCGLYPIEVDGKKAFAMRFEGEKYPLHFVEAISDQKLSSDVVTITRHV